MSPLKSLAFKGVGKRDVHHVENFRARMSKNENKGHSDFCTSTSKIYDEKKKELKGKCKEELQPRLKP